MISTAEAFVRLRTSTNPAEYHRAAHDTAPEPVWHDIITRYPEMRKWVAHNKTVPITILERLCSDPDPAVRSTVAMKRTLPEPLQRYLAQDADSGVRYQLANNAKVTSTVLQLLATDSQAFIRERALQRLAAAPQP